jgi:hypothetical protein
VEPIGKTAVNGYLQDCEGGAMGTFRWNLGTCVMELAWKNLFWNMSNGWLWHQRCWTSRTCDRWDQFCYWNFLAFIEWAESLYVGLLRSVCRSVNGEFWGSHSGEYAEYDLISWKAQYFGISPQMFQTSVSPPSSGKNNTPSKQSSAYRSLLIAGFLVGFLFDPVDGDDTFHPKRR